MKLIDFIAKIKIFYTKRLIINFNNVFAWFWISLYLHKWFNTLQKPQIIIQQNQLKK